MTVTIVNIPLECECCICGVLLHYEEDDVSHQLWTPKYHNSGYNAHMQDSIKCPSCGNYTTIDKEFTDI